MVRRAHVGSRLRERRQVLGVKQSDLAREVGISPAYLNLIEHNKRRIAGKLLSDLARALRVEPSALSEGVGAALVAGLRDAAAGGGALARGIGATDGFEENAPEADRVEEFAERFPGWAALVSEQHGRITALERTVEALTDRLTHDPFLSASMHDVLSVVTAIRSTAGILANSGDIDPEWQARFLRNIYEDSQRLADSSQALVAYLDSDAEAPVGASHAAPQDEFEAWLAGRGFHVAELEGAGAGDQVDALVAGADALQSAPARQLARQWLARYAGDAARMPLEAVEAELEAGGADPAALARKFGVGLSDAMRRMAALPPRPGGVRRFGLVVCDGSGTLTFRQPLEGFTMPRFGAACPYWPLYQALVHPGTPVRSAVGLPGPTAPRFTCFAYCEAESPQGFAMPPVYEATMLIAEGEGDTGAETVPIGSSCRICPRVNCAARREPSILAQGL